jgi:hypothetical protein
MKEGVGEGAGDTSGRHKIGDTKRARECRNMRMWAKEDSRE